MEHPPARGATRAHWVCVDNTVWALRAVRAVADKTLIDRQMTVLPVRLSGQAKPLINSAPRCYPPPHTVAAPPQRHTTSQETTWRPPLPGVSLFRRFRCHLGNLVCAPVRGTSAARGTSRCAPGAFSLTAPVFRSSRAQKGVWCARADLAKPIRYRRRPCGVRKAHNVSRNCTGWRGGEAACGSRWR